MTAPVTVVPGVALHTRVILSLMLGVVLIPVLEPLIGSLPAGQRLAWLALLELLVGGLLGLSAALIVAAARQAGDLVAAQAGLSASALLDPETGEELTPLGQLYGLIALVVFLAMEGPLVLVGALVESYRAVPAGGLGLNEGTVSQVFAQVGGALAFRSVPPPPWPSPWWWRGLSWAGSDGWLQPCPFSLCLCRFARCSESFLFS